jgi:hypothetical protein
MPERPKPLPFKRPPLLLILLREMTPKIKPGMAVIPPQMPRMPSTKDQIAIWLILAPPGRADADALLG